MATEQRLVFTRHADYVQDSSLSELNQELSHLGLLEARKINQLFFSNNIPALGIHYGNTRSIDTVKYSLGKNCIYTLEDHRLNYHLPIRNHIFKSALNEAEKKGVILSFLLYESDTILDKSNTIFSSYRKNYESMSSFIIECLVKKDELNVLACAREYLIACFRAKITEITQGKKIRDYYVVDYNNRRRSVNSIESYIVMVSKIGEQFKLSDWYGGTCFSTNDLISISSENFRLS